MNRFNLHDAKFCKKLIAILLSIILVSSFGAALISSNFGKVKISHVFIDSRGATFEAELYVPAGTKDSDHLPAVVVSHGRGAHFEQVKGFAEELSKRGYVVLNTAAYGTALSEMPLSDEGGQGEEVYFIDDTPQGLLDAIDYLRSLDYVDETRVGIMGHSSGSRKAGFASILDCGYFALNDVLLNVLHEEFGVEISSEDLLREADTIAEENLSEEQMAFYEHLKQEQQAVYDSHIRAICLVGSDANKVGPTAQVTVAGHEVTRTCKVNICIINGEWDFSYRNYNTRDTSKEAWYTGTENIALDTWYSLDDSAQTSTTLDSGSDELSAAIDARATRLYMISENESHAKNVMSSQTTERVINYFDKTLEHVSAIPASAIIFPVRAIFNGIAMLAMLALAIPLLGLYMGKEDAAERKIFVQKINKKEYWLFAAVTVAVTFVAIYLANKGNYSPFASRPFPQIFRLTVTARNTTSFILYTAISALFILLILVVMNKRKSGTLGLENLGINIGLKMIFKYFLYAAGSIAVCYLSLLAIRYLFNQDYRFWLSAFTDMKVEYWGIAAAYALMFLPCYLLTSAAVNYTIRADIPEWKDTLLTIVINSAGLWLCCIVNIVSMFFFDKPFSLFTGSYQMVLFLPLLTYFTRKFYKMTGSIWFGGFFNAMLIAWSLVSSTGINDKFYALGFFSVIFGV